MGKTTDKSTSGPTLREPRDHDRTVPCLADVPETHELLKVVAFFPQVVNEKNANWPFPTIPDVLNILDTFCALSPTYRNDVFVTMLAPLRDHLRPMDPASSTLLVKVKESYFMQLSGEVHPGEPGFEETRCIVTGDINVEHLLNVFTTIDANSESIWGACAKFMVQLYWRKSRLVTLGPKIEALPDDRPSKPQCLFSLSRLFNLVGNLVERKRLLSYSLKLWRERGDDFWVAQILRDLSNANRQMDLEEEGIRQAKEASKIFERFGSVVRQAECLTILAWSLCEAKQLDAAEEAGSRAIFSPRAKNFGFAKVTMPSVAFIDPRARRRRRFIISRRPWELPPLSTWSTNCSG